MKKTILLSLGLFLCSQVYSQLDSAFTVNTGNWYAANKYQAKLAKDLGAKVAGQDGGVFNWRAIQPNINIPITPTFITWNFPDSVVVALQSNGIDLIPTLRSIVPANSTNTNSCSINFSTSPTAYSWLPIGNDTVKWKQFVTAVVDRYDMDGFNDMAGLTKPVNKWRIETEWQLYWCSPFPKDSIATAIEFTKFVNMTYKTIKAKQPGTSSVVSFAGLDTRHDKITFLNGYTGEPNFCLSTSCTSSVGITNAQLTGTLTPPSVAKSRINMLYILKNALYDELDVHQYGRYKFIPKVKQWLKDTAGVTVPINFLEGGGPFCQLCEVSSSQTQLLRWNSSYVVYYYLTGLANKIKRLSWHISSEYKSFSSTPAFGDLDLLDSTIVGNKYVRRPSYFTYRFLAKNVFSNLQSDSVVKINETNPNIYHYQILPLGLHVVWSTNANDQYVVNGSGNLYTYDIPVLANDTTVDQNNYSVNSSYSITLTNNVPVFYSWNNVIGIHEFSIKNNITSVFPNPFSNSTTFIVDANIPVKGMTLQLFDVVGNSVLVKEDIRQSRFTISGENLSPGLYFYRLTGDEKMMGTGKLLIQR